MSDREAFAIVKVKSMSETLRWYGALGFEVRSRADEWAEVRFGDFVLQLLAGRTPWEGEPTLTGSFYVYTESVRDRFAALPDFIESRWGVEERPWGSMELTLQDPNGYFLTFTQPRS